jgi:hypothetical protein
MWVYSGYYTMGVRKVRSIRESLYLIDFNRSRRIVLSKKCASEPKDEPVILIRDTALVGLM